MLRSSRGHTYDRNFALGGIYVVSKRVFWGILVGLLAIVSAATLIIRPARAGTNPVVLPAGYHIEAVVTGLTSPASVTWDDMGRMYVAEAASSISASVARTNQTAPGRVLRIDSETSASVITGLKSIADIRFHDGTMYVAHENMLSAFTAGVRQDLVEAPSQYGVPLSVKVGPDRMIYLGTGAPATGTAKGAIFRIDPAAAGQSIEKNLVVSGLTGPYAFGFLSGDDPALIVVQGVMQGKGKEGQGPSGTEGGPEIAPGYRSGTTGAPPVRITTIPQNATMHCDVAPVRFGSPNDVYLTTFGSLEHGSSRLWTSMTSKQGSASQVLRLDPETGASHVFAQNKTNIPAGDSLTGFNRLVDAEFGPDGCLYLVDMGVTQTEGAGYSGKSGTGAVWRICRQRLGYTNESLHGIRGMDIISKMSVSGGSGSSGGTASPGESQDPWNPSYAELKDELQDYVSGLGGQWGIFFKDLTSGKTFGINEDLPVPAASTVKVPVVLYVANLVSQGKLSWNERLTYNSDRDWRGGAGSLQFTAKDGDSFSMRELAEKAIVESDNVAWKMLERRLGVGNIAGFMRTLGGTVVYPGGQNISTARDMATYMEAALNFARSNAEGEKLMYDLSHTIWNTGLNRFIGDRVEVGHKEGDITGVADDVGIIYADRPYILSIMSKGHDDVELGFEYIGRISQIVYDYQVGLE